MPAQTSQLVNTLIQANNTPQKRTAEILDPAINQSTGPLVILNLYTVLSRLVNYTFINFLGETTKSGVESDQLYKAA